MQPYFRIFLASFFAFPTAHIAAQDSPEPRKNDYAIATNRPSISYSSNSVPHGVFQFESGFQYTYAGRNNFRNNVGYDSYAQIYNIPNIVFRTGITDRWELHLGWDLLKNKFVLNNQTVINEIQSTALSLGSRILVIDKADGWRPQMSFLGIVQLPFTTSQPDGAINTLFRFCMQHNATDKLSVFYNLGADFAEFNNGTSSFLQTTGAYTLGANYAFNSHFNLYGEIYGYLPYRNFYHTIGFNGGVVYLINKQIQLDAVGGFTINDANFSPFFTVGFSAYLKTK